MKPLSHYRRSASEPEVAPVSEPVLVLALPGDPSSGSGEFHTSTRDASAAPLTLEQALRSEGVHVARLAKTSRNPYENFIFVGRAPTCDVIVRASSVSKSHAVFERDEAGAWLVRDNRSRNGTWVNGKRLDAGARILLTSADAIVFGTYPVYFLMPEPFRRILEMLR